jgi:hypothetical protein
VDNTTALDAAVDVLDAHATARNTPIGGFLHARECPATWPPRRHEHLDMVECEGQKAKILKQTAARW